MAAIACPLDTARQLRLPGRGPCGRRETGPREVASASERAPHQQNRRSTSLRAALDIVTRHHAARPARPLTRPCRRAPWRPGPRHRPRSALGAACRRSLPGSDSHPSPCVGGPDGHRPVTVHRQGSRLPSRREAAPMTMRRARRGEQGTRVPLFAVPAGYGRAGPASLPPDRSGAPWRSCEESAGSEGPRRPDDGQHSSDYTIARGAHRHRFVIAEPRIRD